MSVVGTLFMPKERSEKSMFLIFLKLIERVRLFLCKGTLTLNETSLWSEKGISDAVQFIGVTPVPQIRSRMCPLECAAEFISKQDMKSFVSEFVVLFMWL